MYFNNINDLLQCIYLYNHENDVPSWLSSQCIDAHVPKCMSCHKASHCDVTWRAHCFHDCIYIIPILLLRDLSTLCAMDLHLNTCDHLNT